MYSEDSREYSEDLQSPGKFRIRSASGPPRRSAPSTKQSKRSRRGSRVQSRKSKKDRGSQLRKRAEPEPRSQTQTEPAISTSEKEAIQKRAEGRSRVPPKFRDSIKQFFFSPTGVLKILRLGLLMGSITCFIIAEAHESYIAITVLETCIDLLFIIIYMVTLHRLLTYIHWPLLDLMNSFITTVFLLIVAILAMQEKERRHLFYVGGALCLTAAIICLIDAAVVTKTMRKKIKKVMILEDASLSPIPSEAAQQPNNPEAEKAKAVSPAPSVASTVASTAASTVASSRPKEASPSSRSPKR
ncbi:PREDICTED: CKLF-like MARVEL transmembrane domain-containing protein 1 [Miniopterus natalensis]|uniref:CKLF-like MARVEL transmembrane domain-containing protein 1 n=1 Tax=Miniopterus natalensis TaxID=291302 RepID=UPI0007A6EEEC|nr:PREDICTED: CKLF-like MARVEL transmembrane domain-containing protein 1 [Miniopterus natalensis]